ncbi:MAG: SIR2 family protein [Magnetovibrio sp.]|nr:SIR2 family protein [Magnetovibrio sp.]
MIDAILPIPEVPEALKAAFHGRGIVPFIGAGLSQLQGCPDWNGFADKVLHELIILGILNHAEHKQLASMPARVKLSIARKLERTKKVSVRYENIFIPNKNEMIGQQINASLDRISKTLVTTNYDKLLDTLPPAEYKNNPAADTDTSSVLRRDPIYMPGDFTKENLKKAESKVFHIHGSVRAPENMIVSTDEYLRRYSTSASDSTGNREYLDFLKLLFNEKSVLFIGYGANELEILEYVFLKNLNKKSHVREHYVLSGFFSHELRLAQHMEDYFETLGIQLIPFSLDAKGWDQLDSVLSHMADHISEEPEEQLAMRTEMAELLS